jgi:hypothetical protein
MKKATLTLYECRKAYEHFVGPLPKDLPYGRAAEIVREKIGFPALVAFTKTLRDPRITERKFVHCNRNVKGGPRRIPLLVCYEKQDWRCDKHCEHYTSTGRHAYLERKKEVKSLLDG